MFTAVEHQWTLLQLFQLPLVGCSLFWIRSGPFASLHFTQELAHRLNCDGLTGKRLSC